MLTNIRYIFLTALRDNMFWFLLAGVLGAAILAHLMGATAPLDTKQLTTSYSSNAARIMIILGLIIFTCSHLNNAFVTNEVDLFLSRPITRTNLVISYWIGFANVALLHVLATITLTAMQGVINWGGFIFWSLSLLLECWLAVAIALFASFTLKSGVASVMTSIGVYVMARMMAFFIITTHSGFLFEKQWINYILIYALKGISIIMPRLDLFTKSEWLNEGIKFGDFKLFVMQAAVFIPLVLLATIADFRRKQF